MPPAVAQVETGRGEDLRIPEAGFDAGDVGAIQICPFCQHLLSPGFRLSKIPDTGAKRLQQAIATGRHASGSRVRLCLSIDDQ